VIGLYMEALWNSHFYNLFIDTCSAHALYITSASGVSIEEITDTVCFINSEFEQNAGIGVEIDGVTSGRPVQQVHFVGGKHEGNGTASASLKLGYCNHVTHTAMTMSKNASTGPLVHTENAIGAGNALLFDNITFQTGGTWSGATHFDHKTGAAQVTNCYNSGSPSGTFYTIGSSIAADGFLATNINTSDETKRFTDSRTATTTAVVAQDFLRVLSNKKTWDPGNIAADAGAVTTTITVAGAAVGDIATAGLTTLTATGAVLGAVVTATDTVTVTLFNKTGGALDVTSGSLRVDVSQRP
jgi:hypothetical protein